MRQIEKWKWRIRWAGRMATSSHQTEDEIRREHPEAVKIPASRVVLELPETDAEMDSVRQPRGYR